MTLEQFLCAILARAAATNEDPHNVIRLTAMADVWNFALTGHKTTRLYVGLNEPISDEFFNQNYHRIRFY